MPVHMNVFVHRDWKRVSALSELELQVVITHLLWVLVTKLESSERAGWFLKH